MSYEVNPAPDHEYEPSAQYTWRVGDVFTDGTYRWAVASVHGDKAVMRSCGSSWATTIPLTVIEWHEGGRWRLESQEPGR